MSSLNLPLPQLNAANYSNWRFSVECLLDKEGVLEAVRISDDDEKKLTVDQRVNYAKMETKACCIIVQCITDRHLEYVKDAKTARNMMESLDSVFKRKSPFSKLYVMKKLLKLKCNSDDLQDHFIVVESLLRDLEAAGAKLDDTDKACYLLLTMPDKYDVVITAIETMASD
ncbi:hypothetical protein GE061_017687 [Apolygus lucorum]|uniref:Copia protein n=1 Tax=Apolygus lucorum TaxID=248454 RepID=A0A8S9XD47_APOLU|nr:hypothetical protein GE061_017687 [Apolygus lucorum]